MMKVTVKSPYLVEDGKEFSAKQSPTNPPEDAPQKSECKEYLAHCVERLREQQRMLYAEDRRSLLVVFQALDAAGKDGTIRHVFTGVNPAGFQVCSFKQPSQKELEHDFLWRAVQHLPERGRIGVFNRSYYEEVLVVRVHPEFLDAQRLPLDSHTDLWEQRFCSIRNFEEHLALNGTTVIKFWLNVSEAEQRRRFIRRLEQPEKHWKFSARDVEEANYRSEYLQAFQEAIAATTAPHAPWYAIPADDKHFMRFTVADILVRTLDSFDLRYPTVTEERKAELEQHLRELRAKR